MRSPPYLDLGAEQVAALQERLPAFIRKVNGSAGLQDIVDSQPEARWTPCAAHAERVFGRGVSCRRAVLGDEFGAVVVRAVSR